MYAIEFLLFPNFPTRFTFFKTFWTIQKIFRQNFWGIAKSVLKTIKHRRFMWEFRGLLLKKLWLPGVMFRDNPTPGLRDLLLIGESLDATGVQGACGFHYEILPLWWEYWNWRRFPWQNLGYGLGLFEFGRVGWSNGLNFLVILVHLFWLWIT